VTTPRNSAANDAMHLRGEPGTGVELSLAVARSADAADLHAPAPTLLLELQTLLGTLAATVASGTNRGRKPFRPGPDWAQRLGELGYGVYLLADQTGVHLGEAINAAAERIGAAAERTAAQRDDFFERS
jgi:hypothetical protein